MLEDYVSEKPGSMETVQTGGQYFKFFFAVETSFVFRSFAVFRRAGLGFFNVFGVKNRPESLSVKSYKDGFEVWDLTAAQRFPPTTRRLTLSD